MMQETIWSYLPTAGSAVYRALLLAMRNGWDITRLSFDTYQPNMLVDVYHELGYKEENLHFKCFKGNPQNPDYNSQVLAFHQNCLKSGQVSGCIIRLNTVAIEMEKINFPHIVAFPTYNTILEQVSLVYRFYMALRNADGQFVAVFVDVGFPDEYSIGAISNYQFVMDRMRISSQIYRYADLISDSVIEQGIRNYIIFSTQEVVNRQSEFSQTMSLLEWLSVESQYPFVIGLGYGKTLSKAQYHANTAVRKAQREERSCACIQYSDGTNRLYTPKVISFRMKTTQPQPKCRSGSWHGR